MAATREGIAQRLRDLRAATGKTRAEVGQRSGVGERSLFDYEKANARPRSDRVRLLARYYRTSVEWILTGDETTAPRTRLDQIEDHAELLTEALAVTIDRHNKLVEWLGTSPINSRRSAPPSGTLDPIPLPDALLRDLEAGERTRGKRRRSD